MVKPTTPRIVNVAEQAAQNRGEVRVRDKYTDDMSNKVGNRQA